MRLVDLRIDGFGVWTDLRIDQLAPGLNVFYGPNEAGKTTLMQFCRALLYGFSPPRRARYLPPVHGGRPGGSGTIEYAGGQVTLSRHADGAAFDDRRGTLRLSTAAGEPLPDDVLPKLLGHVDEQVYHNLFAIGPREIQELGALNDTDAAQWLYRLSGGLDRVSLVEVTRELLASRQRLLDSAGGPSTIVDLLAQRDKLRLQFGAFARDARRYAALVQERGRLAAEIAASETELATLEQSARLVEAAITIEPKWRERAAIDCELAASADAPQVGDEARQDFERAARRVRQLRRAGRRLRREKSEVKGQIDQLEPRSTLWKQMPRIEGLLEQESWMTALDLDCRARADELVEAERKAAEFGKKIATSATADGEPRTASPDKALRLLHEVARQVAAARNQAAEAEQELQVRRAASTAAQAELAAGQTGRGPSDLVRSLERSGELVSQLRRRVQLDKRLADMARQKAELEAEDRELMARLLLPVGSLVALGGVFVSGSTATLAGLLLPASIVGGAGWGLAALGATAAVGSAAGKVLLERSRQQQAEACHQELDTLAEQIVAAQAEREELDQQLPAGGGPLLARLQAAEREHAELERLLPLDAQLKATLHQTAAAEARAQEAADRYRAARKSWRRALAEAGLPADLAPRQARDLLVGRRTLTATERDLEQRRDRLRQQQAQLQFLLGRLADLAAELNVPLTGLPLAEQFQALREFLRKQSAAATQRAELIAGLRRLRRRFERLKHKLRSAQRQRDAILERFGAADDGYFARLISQSARVDLLRQQRESLAREIEAALAGRFNVPQIAELLDGGPREQLDARWLQLSERVQALRDAAKSAHERLGRGQQEAKTLSEDRDPGRARVQLAIVEQQLREAARRWQVVTTTGLLLDQVRKMYERDRQPETLREASTYLSRLTDGHYARVWTALDAEVLWVDDAQGRALPIEVLSRGTREQLYLSLRLALAGSYARRGIALPLVLDDVLVNFDAQRGRLAALVLRDFAAAGHQVLLLTCHEHIYRLFRSLDVPSRQLPQNGSLVSMAPVEFEAEPVRVALTAPAEVPAALPAQEPAAELRAEIPPPLVPPAPSEPVEAPAQSPPVERVPAPPPAPVAPPRKKPRFFLDLGASFRDPFATAVWHDAIRDDWFRQQPVEDDERLWFDADVGNVGDDDEAA